MPLQMRLRLWLKGVGFGTGFWRRKRRAIPPNGAGDLVATAGLWDGLAPTMAANDEFLGEILGKKESPILEFKRSPHPNKLLQTVVAMSNTDGGAIVVGLEDAKKGLSGAERVFGIHPGDTEKLDETEQYWRNRVNPKLDVEPRRITLDVTLGNGEPGRIVAIVVKKGLRVHAVLDGATYRRAGASNRHMTPAEVVELSRRRGDVDVMMDHVDVDFAFLETDQWLDYRGQRRLTRPLAEALKHAGLAKKNQAGVWQPTRAAVLLFAEDPGGLLNRKASIRVFHYSGESLTQTPHTNLRKPPRTIGGAVVPQIRNAVGYVVECLSEGVTVGPQGFEIAQKYPLRVIQEAITNAVLHRDYSLDADIQIHIFDLHIDVLSPGGYPGPVAPSNIGSAGSHPRNSTLVRHVREFPRPVNLDAGEGVRMMFSTMRASGLYPPLYFPSRPDKEEVRVVLMNEERPTGWEMVSHYLDEHGVIQNRNVRELTSLDTLKASQQLKRWVDRGLLVVANPESGKQNRMYRKVDAEDRFISKLFEKGRGET
jgi:ATP-dependent DNA helicase RecG